MQLFFLDGGGIDNVTLRFWRVSDFCSRHTVGVASDDIMFHILVFVVIVLYLNKRLTIETPVIWDTIALIMTPLLWRLKYMGNILTVT